MRWYHYSDLQFDCSTTQSAACDLRLHVGPLLMFPGTNAMLNKRDLTIEPEGEFSVVVQV
jgi:hypothetical protein